MCEEEGLPANLLSIIVVKSLSMACPLCNKKSNDEQLIFKDLNPCIWEIHKTWYSNFPLYKFISSHTPAVFNQ